MIINNNGPYIFIASTTFLSSQSGERQTSKPFYKSCVKSCKNKRHLLILVHNDNYVTYLESVFNFPTSRNIYVL